MNAIKLLHSESTKKILNPLIVTVPDIAALISFCAFDVVYGSLCSGLIVPFTVSY